MRDEQCDADFLVLFGGGRRGAQQVQGAALEVGLVPATRKKKKKQESEEPVKQHPKGGGLLRAPSTPPASPPSPHFLLRSTSLIAERRDSPTAKVASLGGRMAVEKAVAGMEAFEGGACDGFGRKLYANGDYYEGGWRRGLQEGQGRYVWRNGNQYVGQWRGGVISGRGVLVWTDGSRYEGRWEGGVPRGGGVFTWPDGGRYIGGWAKDPMNQRQLHGTFYPSGRSAVGRHCQMLPRRSNPYPNPSPLLYLASPSSTVDGDGDGDAHQVPPLFRKRYSVDGTSGKGGSITEKSLPRICIWESDGEGGDITCEIIDTLEASMLCRSGGSIAADAAVAGVDRGVQRRRERSPCSLVGNEAKKPGQTVAKGHKNYDLMLNLQLGIRYSTSKHASSTQVRGLRQGDFDPREMFWTRFPPEGSKITPPHQSVEFRWKDYCPMVFRHLRKLFAVDPADYMLAICGDDALRELSSPGKSGSLFYLTQDDRFIIKTVKKSEVKVLIRMLSNYYQHVCRYKDSLVTKFYGVHCVKPLGGQKVRFIVMGNFFCSEYRIHRRFDLKGSSHGRMIDRAEEEIDETTTLKDLDLNFAFCLSHYWFKALLEQVDRDCEFLETEGIMDYSLLVGLHFRDDLPTSATGERDFVGDGRSVFELYPEEPAVGATRHVLSDRSPLMRLGVNLPAKAERICRSRPKSYLLSLGASTTPECSDTYNVVLNFGIIDILQDYDISKKLEHAYKSLQADPASISAVDPKLYSKRFRDFIRRVFVEVR